MRKTIGLLVFTMLAAMGTGCCFDQCGGCYNQCGGAYDPCTGLVQSQCDPWGGPKRVIKKFRKDDCDCHKHDCDCHKRDCDCKHREDSCGCHKHDHCSCNHDRSYSSGCPCESYGGMMETYGEPIYGEPIYGEPVYYGEPMETYSNGESYPELMPPQEARPMKPVPAPPAEPDELPTEESSIPPTSYVVPAPLDGPSVPVLQPFHGR